MKLIVGLGNPGRAYTKTRHNIGFLVVDFLAKSQGAVWTKKITFQGELTEIKNGREKTILLKPQTFMNRSGESVRAVASFYKIPLSKITVVHDDADLSFGEIRTQVNRSAAGHNGVQSIIDQFGGEKGFSRIRVGIDRSDDPHIP